MTSAVSSSKTDLEQRSSPKISSEVPRRTEGCSRRVYLPQPCGNLPRMAGQVSIPKRRKGWHRICSYEHQGIRPEGLPVYEER